MAGGLPRYEPSEQVNVGPLKTTADTYAQYSKMFGEIASATKPIADSFISQSIKDRAEVDGNNPGFKTVLPIGAGAKLYNEVGLAQNKQFVSADIIKNINQFKQEALGYDKNGNIDPNSPGLTTDSLEAFNTKLAGYSNQLLSTIPKANRNYVTQLLSAHSTVAQTSLQNQWHKNQLINANIDGVSNWNTNMDYMINANSSGDPILQGVAQTMMRDNISQLKSQALIYGTTKTNQMIEDTKKKFYTSHYTGLATNYLQNNHPELLDDLKERLRTDSDAQNSLGIHGQNSLISTITSMQNQHLQNSGITTQYINNLMKSDLASSEQQIDPDPNNLSQEREYLISHHREQDWETHVQNIEYNKNIFGVANQVKTTTLEDAPELIQQLVDQKSNLDPRDPNYTFQAGALDKAIKTAQQYLDTRTKDKATAAMQYYGGYKAVEQQSVENPEAFPGKNKLDYIINSQRAQNFDSGQFQIAPNKRISNDSSVFSGLSAPAQIQFLNERTKEFGPYLGIYLRQLQNKLKTGGLLSLYSVSNDPATAQYAQGVMNALTHTPDFYNKTHDESGTSFGKIQKEVHTNLMTSGNILDIYHSQGIDIRQYGPLEHGIALYAAYRLANNKDNTMQDAVTNACKIMVNDHYTSGSFNGVNYAIPKSTILNQPIDDKRTQAILKLKASEVLNGKDIYINPVSLPIYKNSTQSINKQQYIDNLKISSHWRNIGNSGYMLVDHNGNPITTFLSGMKNPEPVKVSYDEIADLTSPLNGKLNEKLKNVGDKINKSMINIYPKWAQSTVSTPSQDLALDHIISQPISGGPSFLETKLNHAKIFLTTHPQKFFEHKNDPLLMLLEKEDK